jgi:hypothetical protein
MNGQLDASATHWIRGRVDPRTSPIVIWRENNSLFSTEIRTPAHSVVQLAARLGWYTDSAFTDENISRGESLESERARPSHGAPNTMLPTPVRMQRQRHANVSSQLTGMPRIPTVAFTSLSHRCAYSVSIVTVLRSTVMTNWDSIPGKGKKIFSVPQVRSCLGPKQPPQG